MNKNNLDFKKSTLNLDESGKLWFYTSFIGHCYQEVDGFYVYKPNEISGQYNEYSLRLIADFLEELNKPLNDKLNQDLSLKDSEGDIEPW